MSAPLQEFWGRIHRSYALVPAFGMSAYYESRISSTIIASLITGQGRGSSGLIRPPDEDSRGGAARVNWETKVLACKQA